MERNPYFRYDYKNMIIWSSARSHLRSCWDYLMLRVIIVEKKPAVMIYENWGPGKHSSVITTPKFHHIALFTLIRLDCKIRRHVIVVRPFCPIKCELYMLIRNLFHTQRWWGSKASYDKISRFFPAARFYPPISMLFCGVWSPNDNLYKMMKIATTELHLKVSCI